ncbi:hypothetical protein LSH36_314g00001 [Paralvinella palmiformis]|uniref:Fucosyltransferase n=1 Tax=Paralvinella palmiformis TaxID=53620 RepID=A0AAD9JIR6_9ANNE|nr:hypothetical protein LSH36_314g00001 [Paralvinella palmiformis]
MDEPPSNITIAKKKDMKIILLWNTVFGDPTFGLGQLGTAVFDQTRCPHTCYLTKDRSELSQADAVLVHTFNMASLRHKSGIPPRTNSRQIFVFYIKESPLKSYNGFFQVNFNFSGVFNLTFTYLHSPMTDVYAPLGGIKKKNRSSKFTPISFDDIKKKTKMVAWFVSNCHPPSARMQYAKHLSRYVDVDVFGKCGNLTCLKTNKTCTNYVSKTYMFYLAFENSFCRDYATEKVFRTLQGEMVPIVYGYVNYSDILPPKSYIDVRDYDSPKTLGKFLKELSRNRKKYREYFNWKKHYKIKKRKYYSAVGFCRLCSILHNTGYQYKTNFDPVHDYWNPKKLCLTGKKEKLAVHLRDN